MTDRNKRFGISGRKLYHIDDYQPKKCIGILTGRKRSISILHL